MMPVANPTPTIIVDLEKLLDMIIQNADNLQNSCGEDEGKVVITSLNQVGFYYPSSGKVCPDGHAGNPEFFLNNKALDMFQLRLLAKEIVLNESGKYIPEFEDREWKRVSELITNSVEEWKKRARQEKKEILRITDSQWNTVAEYKIEWI